MSSNVPSTKKKNKGHKPTERVTVELIVACHEKLKADTQTKYTVRGVYILAGKPVNYKTTWKILKLYQENGSVSSLWDAIRKGPGSLSFSQKEEDVMKAKLLIHPDFSYTNMQKYMMSQLNKSVSMTTVAKTMRKIQSIVEKEVAAAATVARTMCQMKSVVEKGAVEAGADIVEERRNENNLIAEKEQGREEVDNGEDNHAGFDGVAHSSRTSAIIPKKRHSTPVELVNHETGQFLVGYNSIAEAARNHGINPGTLYNCIQARRLCKGLFFRYPQQPVKRPRGLDGSFESIPVELVNLQTGQFLVRYNKIAEAARAHGINRGTLYSCLQDRRLCKGLFFRHQGSGVMPRAKKPPKPRRAAGGKIEKLNFLAEAVIAEYGSVKEAAVATGISITSINSCLSGRSKSAQGFRWRYKAEPRRIKRRAVAKGKETEKEEEAQKEEG
jgi:hypothetical protein